MDLIVDVVRNRDIIMGLIVDLVRNRDIYIKSQLKSRNHLSSNSGQYSQFLGRLDPSI